MQLQATAACSKELRSEDSLTHLSCISTVEPENVIAWTWW